jgi:hypothetical protein
MSADAAFARHRREAEHAMTAAVQRALRTEAAAR